MQYHEESCYHLRKSTQNVEMIIDPILRHCTKLRRLFILYGLDRQYPSLNNRISALFDWRKGHRVTTMLKGLTSPRLFSIKPNCTFLNHIKL